MPTAAERLKARRIAYQRLFATEDGQVVLRDLMRQFGFFKSTYLGAGMSATDMAFCEGQRSVVLHLLDSMRKQWDNPGRVVDDYEAILNEQQEHDQ